MTNDTKETPLAELGFNETGVYGGKIIRAVVDYSDDSSAIVPVAVLQDMARRCALNAELLAALKAIQDHKPDTVTDKIDHDVENCADCKRMEGHPISHGRCNEWYHQHYRIKGKQADSDNRQQYQMRTIARTAIARAESQQ